MSIALLYKRLLQLGKIAGALTFLFGIPYGIWQYWGNLQDKRVEQSLRLFEKFNSSPFTTYREEINKALASHRNEIEEAAKAGEQQLGRAISKVIGETKIESSFWLILDFFDGVAICVVQNICDAATVGQLFTDRAEDFYITFYQYIKAQRRGPRSATFGLGLETIATSHRRK